jgi:tRNA pseudouridine38-40 synthase
MDEAARFFVGEHDFTSFCAAASDAADRTRTIFAAAWERAAGEDEWIFRIQGSGFLQYMVRTIVGTLLSVGTGKMSGGKIPEIFMARDRTLAGPSVPPTGLHLMSVEY